MDRITIQDLTVHFHVGVPAQERANPQRLTLTAEIESDFSRLGDDLGRAIDYFAISQRMLEFGRGRSWKLIETLARGPGGDDPPRLQTLQRHRRG